MAQELDHLIGAYEEHGLRRAAHGLRHLKTALIVGGLLPPSLTAVLPADEQDDVPRAPVASTPSVRFAEQVRRLEEQPDGRVILRPTPQELQERELLETLSSSRAYHALVRAGFKTVVDVEFAIEHQLLRRIRRVSPAMAAEIEEAIRGRRRTADR